MRQILVEHARSHGAAKRGGGAPKIALDEALDCSREQAAALVELDEALTALAVFGFAHVTGATDSTNFTLKDAYQSNLGGLSPGSYHKDAFVTRILISECPAP